MADDEQEDMEVTNDPVANENFDINILPPVEVPPLPAPIISESGDTGRLIITHITNVNFKSYAGKQVLGPFHKSFSSIVGPNGSGKSNVIDSMLFVFGFRATKIRSKKLSVLIHDSEHHRDVDSCTVSVHFQKIKDTGVAADAFEVMSGTQLVVSRTAHRDNSSYYTLNGRRTNFKEVACVLRSSGIDLDHNRFLILQGEVEQIAMMKPKAPTENEDGMLEYLEDIVGSSRYKAPIDTLADRVSKLNELRSEKLNRVKAVEKEKESLEGVKNEAIEYLSLQNEVTHRKNVLYQKYQADCAADEANATAKRDAAKQKAEDLASRLAEVEGDKKSKSKEHQKAIRAFESASKACEEAKAAFAELERRDAKAREDLKHSKANSKKLDKSIETDRQKAEELRRAPAAAEKEQAALRAKLDELATRKAEEEDKRQRVLDGLKTETQGLQDKKSVLEQQLLSLQKDLSSKKSQRDLAQSELDLARSSHAQESKKLETMLASYENVKRSLGQKQSEIVDMKTRLPQTLQSLSKCEKDLEGAATSEAAIGEKLRAARSRVEEGRSALQSARSRGAVLESLLEQRRQGKISSRVLGRLGDLGAIDSKYDVAVSTACGSLDNIVVDTVDVAQRCVEYLKKSGVGAATFICLDKMTTWAEQSTRKVSAPENVTRLFDLVTYKDEQLRGAFYYALRDTLVAADLDQATRVAYGKTRYRVVTIAGQLIDISGTMSGGGGRPMRGRMGGSVAALDVTPEQQADAEQALGQVQMSLETCRENRAKLVVMCEKLQATVKELQHGLDRCAVEVKGLTEQEASLKAQLVEQEVKVKSTVPDPAVIERLEKQLAVFDKDYQQAAKESSKIEADVQKLHKEIMDVGGTKLKSVETRLSAIASEIATATSQMTKIGVGVKTSERNLKKTESKIMDMEKELAETLKAIEDIEKRLLVELEEQGASVMEANQAQQSKLKDAESELAAIQKVVSEFEEQQAALQKENVDSKHELRKYEDLVTDCHNKVLHWRKELSKLKLNSIDSLSADDGGNASGCPALPTKKPEELEDVNKEEITSAIASIGEKLAGMRPNMAAIAEYRKKEELYIQRVADLDAVTEARDVQRRQHDELRKRRLDEFMAGFAIITRHLKEMYQMITLGGDAELELVDSLDPFSEGVVFSVRPPKKSWKNIANLSGGEKTLSSLALVFALHHFKPTPLYVMDEIDAALDFKNVSIVANYIKERTKNAQFIIISLRNNMFELADRLIGIYKTDNCTKSVAINPKELSCSPNVTCSAAPTAPVSTTVM